MWRRLFSAGQTAGTLGWLLVLGAGVAVTAWNAPHLEMSLRGAPVERSCKAWLKDPSGPRWVTLTGCKLDLSAAAARRWKGFISLRDGEVSGAHYVQLYVPLAWMVGDESPPRGVLVTSEAGVLSLLQGLDDVSRDAAPGWLEAHADQLDAVLEPQRLTGLVEPLEDLPAHGKLGMLTAPGAVVLRQGATPPLANPVAGVVLGAALALLGGVVLARRARGVGADEAAQVSPRPA